jgi:hypothetical protein
MARPIPFPAPVTIAERPANPDIRTPPAHRYGNKIPHLSSVLPPTVTEQHPAQVVHNSEGMVRFRHVIEH